VKKNKKEIFVEKPEKLAERVFREIVEKKEEEKEILKEEERMIREKLEREIKLMKFSPQRQDEATKKAQKIKALNVQGKIKNLLVLAREEGVSFAVKVAEGLNDPYTLDIFHDILARESLFKKFKK
jgi:hypothetical protein